MGSITAHHSLGGASEGCSCSDRISRSHSWTRGCDATWAREHLFHVQAVVQLEDHDQTAAAHVDVHRSHAGFPQAFEHLGPHTLVIVAVGGDGGGVVAEIDRQDVASHADAKREILYFTGKVNVISRILASELC